MFTECGGIYVEYKNHYLTNAILRIDFVSLEESLKESLKPEVKNICTKYFPISENRQVEFKQVRVNNGIPQADNLIKLEKNMEWHFLGIRREKEITISSKAVVMNFKEYKTFDDFKNQFFEVFDVLTQHYPDIKINRIGLRYVDQIKLPLEKRKRKSWSSYWGKYINSCLVKNLQFVDDDLAITRGMNSIEMNYGNYMLRFQYGIYNEDYPAPNKKNIFILDTDVYSMGLFSIDDTKILVDIYHQQAEKWFEKSIKQELRKKMEAIENE